MTEVFENTEPDEVELARSPKPVKSTGSISIGRFNPGMEGIYSRSWQEPGAVRLFPFHGAW